MDPLVSRDILHCFFDDGIGWSRMGHDQFEAVVLNGHAVAFEIVQAFRIGLVKDDTFLEMLGYPNPDADGEGIRTAKYAGMVEVEVNVTIQLQAFSLFAFGEDGLVSFGSPIVFHFPFLAGIQLV